MIINSVGGGSGGGSELNIPKVEDFDVQITYSSSSKYYRSSVTLSNSLVRNLIQRKFQSLDDGVYDVSFHFVAISGFAKSSSGSNITVTVSNGSVDYTGTVTRICYDDSTASSGTGSRTFDIAITKIIKQN